MSESGFPVKRFTVNSNNLLSSVQIGGQGTVTNMLRKIKITLQRCSCHCDRLESKREPHPTSGVADRDSMTLVSASTLIETCGKGNSNRTAGAIVHRVETKADINIDKDGTVEEDTVPVAVDLQRDTTREERSGKNRGRDDVGSSTTQHTRANKRTKDVPKCPITGLRSRIPLSKLKIVIGEFLLSVPLIFPLFLFGHPYLIAFSSFCLSYAVFVVEKFCRFRALLPFYPRDLIPY